MKPARKVGLAAVCASAVPDGIMESKSGRAMAAPTPCRKVRRCKCFFVRNMDGQPPNRFYLYTFYLSSARGVAATVVAPAPPAGGIASASTERVTVIWNGGLLTTPRTRAEKR